MHFLVVAPIREIQKYYYQYVTTVRSRERTGIASRDPGSRDTGKRERYTLVITIIKYLLNGSLAVNVYVLYSVIVSVSVSVNIYKCVDV